MGDAVAYPIIGSCMEIPAWLFKDSNLENVSFAGAAAHIPIKFQYVWLSALDMAIWLPWRMPTWLMLSTKETIFLARYLN